MKTNVLYCGDNLHILRDYIPDGSIDLIYLDPPFNCNRSYNVLFKEQSGVASDAQIPFARAGAEKEKGEQKPLL